MSQYGSSSNNNKGVAKGVLRMAAKGTAAEANPESAQSRLGLEDRALQRVDFQEGIKWN